jgi:hypothetical protein
VCELDGAAGGLARITGRASRSSLSELARGVRDARAPFEVLDGGIRLIATEAQRPIPGDADSVAGILRQAQPAHIATIVDCGRVNTPGAAVGLAVASHIVWVVPADDRAAHTVEATLLDGDPGLAPGASSELVAAISHEGAAARADLGLRNAVAERCERLVLIPSADLRAEFPGPKTDALTRALAPILEFVGLRRVLPPTKTGRNLLPMFQRRRRSPRATRDEAA